MLKKTVIVCLGIVVMTTLQAQRIKGLSVESKNNEKSFYALELVQKLEINSKNFNVILKDGSKKDFLYKDILKIIIDTACLTSVDENVDSDESWTHYIDSKSDVLTINGPEKNTPIFIYNIKGVLVLAAIATETSTTFDVHSLLEGIYLLQIGKTTKKIIIQ